ncbi:alpha/beta hydrolase family esterase [Zavarzinia sp. CC-PAN008]|uniref:alpha/beta hydrolase family esterase n=1 Tax=Zavarzinia sp. CC-PAN008 TaxID=3243332 RepID=UPI003F745C64
MIPRLAGLALALAFALAGPAPAHADGPAVLPTEQVTVGGHARTYLVYVPDRLPRRAPILMLLHGSGDSGAIMRERTTREFEPLAVRDGAVVVYPDGFGNHWNDCRRHEDFSARSQKIDDEAFLLAIADRLAATVGADRDRILVMGWSNGGQMALRMALTHPDRVPAVAAISASLPAPDNMECTASGRPVRVMIVNGTADPVNPFAGGEVRLGSESRGTVLSTLATAEYFAGLDHDPAERTTRALPSVFAEDRTAIELMSWGPRQHPHVVLYTVHGGGHAIPSARAQMPWYLGPTSRNLESPQAIWDFFTERGPHP